MSIRLDKPWRRLDTAGALPGQLGVFQLGDAAGKVIYIGCAGARSLFGLRGEVQQAGARVPGAVSYRCEVTTAYRTRYQELLMLHQADHGRLPEHHPPVSGLGRLSPA